MDYYYFLILPAISFRLLPVLFQPLCEGEICIMWGIHKKKFKLHDLATLSPGRFFFWLHPSLCPFRILQSPAPQQKGAQYNISDHMNREVFNGKYREMLSIWRITCSPLPPSFSQLPLLAVSFSPPGDGWLGPLSVKQDDTRKNKHFVCFSLTSEQCI